MYCAVFFNVHDILNTAYRNFGVWTFVLIQLVYVEIECQLNATEVFIEDLIACSTCFGHHYAHHQELKQRENHSTKYHRQQPLYNTLELLMMGIVVPETCWASNEICNKNLCLSSWHFISTYFHIFYTPIYREEITKFSTNHRAKLLTHPNELTSNLLIEQGPRRLKLYKPLDLPTRFP